MIAIDDRRPFFCLFECIVHAASGDPIAIGRPDDGAQHKMLNRED
jgi:hypothetical protein